MINSIYVDDDDDDDDDDDTYFDIIIALYLQLKAGRY